MTVFLVVLGLVVIAIFTFAVFKLNAYSEVTYGYTPINMENILLGFIPWIIIIAGIFGENHGEKYSLTLGIFFAAVAAIYIFKEVARKTSIGVAIATVVIAMTLNVAMFLLALAEEQRRNSNYYYDD